LLIDDLHKQLILATPIPSDATANHNKTYWIAWRKSREGFIKINFDGSKSSHRVASGYIIRNSVGKFIQVAVVNLKAASILVTEAITMRNGIGDAIEARYTKLHIKGDKNSSFKQSKVKFKRRGKSKF